MIEYYKIFIMFVVCVILALVILGASYIIKSKNYNWEKISSYECGFQPFEDTRSRFDVKFYLVAILFIIFDLEIAYLFPCSLKCSIVRVVSFFLYLFDILSLPDLSSYQKWWLCYRLYGLAVPKKISVSLTVLLLLPAP